MVVRFSVNIGVDLGVTGMGWSQSDMVLCGMVWDVWGMFLGGWGIVCDGMARDGMGWSGDGQGMVRGWSGGGMGWYGIEMDDKEGQFDKT